MSDTRPNIVVTAQTVVDIYAETTTHSQGAIEVGAAIAVQMIGGGIAKLYAGATLTDEPMDDVGYEPIYQQETAYNESGDAGAFIWSEHGCVINVKEY